MSSAATPRLPVSVVIISRHGAAYLPRCIRSVRDWVDEVIIALNNETDNSAEVATALGARVIDLEWRGHRDTKNEANSHARNRWILSIDADEEVPPALRDEIIRFMANADGSPYVAARFPRMTWFLNRWIRHGDWYPDHCTRLFRTDKARWGGAMVHERLEYDGPVFTFKSDLLHYSFDSIWHAVKKLLSTADIAAEEHRARGRAAPTWEIFTRPCWGFFRCYVLKRGFLDGMPGLICAGLAAFGRFTKYARRYELLKSRKPE